MSDMQASTKTPMVVAAAFIFNLLAAYPVSLGLPQAHA
jgi:hypothetical protein